jgi:hypothetical protein
MLKKRERSLRAIRKRVKKLELEVGVPVKLLEDFSGLPIRLQDELLQSKSESHTRGIFDPATKQVYLIECNIPSARVATEVYFHEALGHLGAFEILGERVDCAMRQIYRATPRVTRRLLKEKYRPQLKGLSGKERRKLIACEYLAHIAELGVKDSWLCRIESILRALIRLFYPWLRWNTSELIHLLIIAKEKLRDSGGPELSDNHMAVRLTERIEKLRIKQGEEVR